MPPIANGCFCAAWAIALTAMSTLCWNAGCAAAGPIDNDVVSETQLDQGDDAPANDARANDAPADNALATDARSDDAPTDGARSDDAPTDGARSDDARSDDARSDDTRSDDARSTDAPADDAIVDDLGGINAWWDAPLFAEALVRPARPSPRKAGLSDVASVGQACTGVVSGAAVLCVEVGGGGAGSAIAPFGTIQAAVDAAKDGDVIQIAGGEYHERVLIDSKSLTLRGGFAGSGDFNESTPAKHVTTIVATADDTGLWIDYAEKVVVSGLRVTGGGGRVFGDDPPEGGGVYLEGGSVRVENCLFENNDTTTLGGPKALSSFGGAVYSQDCTLELDYNVIRGNKSGKGAVAAFGAVRVVGNEIRDNVAIADHGGGLYLAGPRIEVLGNYVAGNKVGTMTSASWGGGIIVFDIGTRATLAYNVWTANSAGSIGSGVFIDDGAQALIVNDLIYGNACPDPGAGAGLYVDGLDTDRPSAAYVVNSTIAAHDCSTATAGSAIFLEQRSAVKLRNSILWGNGGKSEIAGDSSSGARASYTISADRLPGEGNLSGNPLFSDSGQGDFHLASTAGRWIAEGVWMADGSDSIAIDAGNPLDPVGAETAPNGGRINLGAFGGTSEASRSRPAH